MGEVDTRICINMYLSVVNIPADTFLKMYLCLRLYVEMNVEYRVHLYGL